MGAASGSWWQQKYYSSPTHTVDSGFEDNGNVKRHGHPMLSHVFTEEDELQEQNKDHLDTLQGLEKNPDYFFVVLYRNNQTLLVITH